jgi:uncharacterized membrane protein
LAREEQKAVVQTILAKFHAGPLPPPEDLEAYQRLIPDGADRIMRMWEKEQEHRHTREDENDQAEVKLKGRGQLIAAAIAGSLIILAAVFGFTRHDSLAKTILTITVIALVSVFALDRVPSWLGNWFDHDKKE